MLSTNLYYFFIFSGRAEIVKLLLEEGADYTCKDREGNYFFEYVSNREDLKANISYIEKNYPIDGAFQAKMLEYKKQITNQSSIRSN